MIRFKYPVENPTRMVELPSADFGDVIRTPLKVKIHKTMAGWPITTIKTGLAEKHEITISNICDYSNFMLFLEDHGHSEMLLSTERAIWRGRIITDPLPIATHSGGREIKLVFEGYRRECGHIRLKSGGHLLSATRTTIAMENIK